MEEIDTDVINYKPIYHLIYYFVSLLCIHLLWIKFLLMHRFSPLSFILKVFENSIFPTCAT